MMLLDPSQISAHQLRRPLNSIGNLLQILKLKNKDQNLTEVINMLLEELREVSATVTEFLSLAKSNLELRLAPINYEQIETSVHRYIGAPRNVVFHWSTRDSKTVFVDHVKFVNILCILIDNGLKFNESSKPLVYVTSDDYESIDDSVCTIHVIDNGIGLSPENIEQILTQKTFRVRDSAPGTGLGIMIAKELIERHGGVLQINSKLNEGSDFYFTIPKKRGLDAQY